MDPCMQTPNTTANGEVMLSSYIKYLQQVLDTHGDLPVANMEDGLHPPCGAERMAVGPYNSTQGTYDPCVGTTTNLLGLDRP